MPTVLFIQPTQYGPDGSLCKQKKIHLPGLVFPHLSPAFTDDGWLYWARQSGSGGVEICRADGAQATPSCRDSGYGWIDTLAPAAGGTWASLSDGDLSWKKVWVPF